MQVVAWVLLLAAGVLGCRPADSQGSRQEDTAFGSSDRVAPREVEVARFRDGLVEPGGLSGGAESRDQLVRRFVAALEQRDTMALGAMVLTRAEFAYLYYPTAPESAPPYDLSPALMWFTLQQGSRSGLFQALDERGGRRLHLLGYSCASERREGANTLWGPCLIRRLAASGDTVSERLFGPIITRGGRHKFVSLTNSL